MLEQRLTAKGLTYVAHLAQLVLHVKPAVDLGYALVHRARLAAAPDVGQLAPQRLARVLG